MKPLKQIKIRCFWEKPDEPPIGSFNYDKNEAFYESEVFSVPEVGETITLDLVMPQSMGFPILPTVVHGEVKKVTKKSAQEYELILERRGRIGLSYADLGACIGTMMVGFHPLLGRVEGQLKGLLPKKYELALLEVPELNELHKIFYQAQTEAEDMEFDEEETHENAIVILSWSSLWSKQGLEIMKQSRKK
jgi:hypothetical protein